MLASSYGHDIGHRRKVAVLNVVEELLEIYDVTGQLRIVNEAREAENWNPFELCGGSNPIFALR
jgi:hypothetical protein